MTSHKEQREDFMHRMGSWNIACHTARDIMRLAQIIQTARVKECTAELTDRDRARLEGAKRRLTAACALEGVFVRFQSDPRGPCVLIARKQMQEFSSDGIPVPAEG